MFYDMITIFSLLVNVYLLIIPRQKIYTFDKKTSIACRVAESKHLTNSDKVSILAADLDNIEFNEVEFWKLNGLKHKLEKKISYSKTSRTL
jgi:hypothetical protein